MPNNSPPPAPSGISLRAALARVWVALLVLAALGIAAGAVFVQWRATSRAADEFLARKAEQYAQLIEVGLDGYVRLLRVEGRRDALRAAAEKPAGAQRVIADLQNAWPEMFWIGVVDANGRLLAGSRDGAFAAATALGAPAADGEPQPTIRGPRPAAQWQVLDFRVPLYDDAGRAWGALLAAIDVGHLERPSRVTALTRSTQLDFEVAVFDARGLVHPVGAQRLAKLVLAADAAGNGAQRQVDTEGVRLRVAHAPVSGSFAVRALGWQAVATMPERAVFTAVAPAALGAALGALAALALLTPVILYLARRTAAPIARLNRSVQGERAALLANPVAIPVAGYAETIRLGVELRALLAELAAQSARLAAREAAFRSLFYAQPVPMWVCRQSDLRIVEVNDAAVAFYGWSRDEFLQMSVFDLRLPDEHDELAVRAADVRAEQPALRRLDPRRHRCKDGREIDVEPTIAPLDWNGEAAWLTVVFDITDRLQSETQLHELSRQLLEAEAEQRRALSQTLHDRFAQDLAAAKFEIEAVLAQRAQAPGAPLAAAERLAAVAALLGRSLADVRGLLNELRPPLLADFGLRAALRYEIDRRAPADAQRIDFAPDGGAPEPRLDAMAEYALFMIAREALANALAHAPASRVALRLALAPGQAEVEVRDDGPGFVPAQAAMKHGHLGLVGMRERAQLIGAALAIDSAPGRGTCVRATWRAPEAAA